MSSPGPPAVRIYKSFADASYLARKMSAPPRAVTEVPEKVAFELNWPVA